MTQHFWIWLFGKVNFYCLNWISNIGKEYLSGKMRKVSKKFSPEKFFFPLNFWQKNILKMFSFKLISFRNKYFLFVGCWLLLLLFFADENFFNTNLVFLCLFFIPKEIEGSQVYQPTLLCLSFILVSRLYNSLCLDHFSYEILSL